MDVHSRRWSAPPEDARSADLTSVAAALRSRQEVGEVWLAGDIQRFADGTEQTNLAVALVVEQPKGASERPELLALVERLDAAVSAAGLEVTSWAFVSQMTVEREISACGIRLFPLEDNFAS